MKGILFVAIGLSISLPAQAEAILDELAARSHEGGRVEQAPLGPVFLTTAQRRARAEQIRDTAAAAGMTNGALLAGIGEVETNFAHCWSEATWACMGSG